MAVPKVRNAVHKATAPREYALPKTRERGSAGPMGISAVPCPAFGTPDFAGSVMDVPDDTLAPRIPLGSPIAPGGPFARNNPEGLPPGGGDDDGGGGGGAIPEPHVWLQMLLGMLLVGGSVRLARRQPSEEEEALIERLDVIKKDVPR